MYTLLCLHCHYSRPNIVISHLDQFPHYLSCSLPLAILHTAARGLFLTYQSYYLTYLLEILQWLPGSIATRPGLYLPWYHPMKVTSLLTNLNQLVFSSLDEKSISCLKAFANTVSFAWNSFPLGWLLLLTLYASVQMSLPQDFHGLTHYLDWVSPISFSCNIMFFSCYRVYSYCNNANLCT